MDFHQLFNFKIREKFSLNWKLGMGPNFAWKKSLLSIFLP